MEEVDVVIQKNWAEVKPFSKELLTKTAAEAMDYAVARSARMAAIVNVGEISSLSGITHEELVKQFPGRNWSMFSVEQLTTSKPLDAPKESRGVIVTGYSDELYGTKNERGIQDFVRKESQAGLPVLIVSSSLPDTGIFKHPNPWFNGPFQNDAIWSMSHNEQGVVLIRKKLVTGELDQESQEYQKEWKPISSSLFKYDGSFVKDYSEDNK